MANKTSQELEISALEGYFRTFQDSFLHEFHKLTPHLPLWHLMMLKDRERFEFYRDLIRDSVKDKIVLDIGTGSGILSYLSLKYGAKKVYSVEENPVFQSIYKGMMNGFIQEGKAELLAMDAGELTPDFFKEGLPEVIVHEIFGADGLSEGVLGVFNRLSEKGLLKGTEIIPSRFQVMIRPVLCESMMKASELEDFEGFPFSVLSKLNDWKPREYYHDETKMLAPVPAGKAAVVMDYDLNSCSFIEESTVNVVLDTKFSHFHRWLKIIHNQKFLESNHLHSTSHWVNFFDQVPESFRKDSSLSATYKVVNGQTILFDLRK